MKLSEELDAKRELYTLVKREHEDFIDSSTKLPDFERIRDRGYTHDEINYDSRNLVREIIDEVWNDHTLHERYYWTLTDFDNRYGDYPKEFRNTILSICKTHLELCERCNKNFLSLHNDLCRKYRCKHKARAISPIT